MHTRTSAFDICVVGEKEKGGGTEGEKIRKSEQEEHLVLYTAHITAYSFRDSLGWLVFMIFGFFNSNPNFYINCQTFQLQCFRAHLHTTLGILLMYNNQVS